MKVLGEVRVAKMARVSFYEKLYGREFPKEFDVLGVSYEIREKLGDGAQGHVFAAVDPEGRRVSLKLYTEDGSRTHTKLVKASRSGIPSIVDEATSFDSKSSIGVYRFIHGITVHDVVDSTEVDTTLKTKIVDGYRTWKERFCRDAKSSCMEFNVVFDFESSQFYLIDAE